MYYFKIKNWKRSISIKFLRKIKIYLEVSAADFCFVSVRCNIPTRIHARGMIKRRQTGIRLTTGERSLRLPL